MRCSICEFVGAFIIITIIAIAFPAQGAALPAPVYSGSYAVETGSDNLDLYLPTDRCGPFPLVIYIHGGGWVAGDKSQVTPYLESFLARGLAIASVNYRFSFLAHFPAQIYDCKAAVRWLRAHADEFELEAGRIGVLGESAGGNLASLVGLTGDDPNLEGNLGGNLEFSSRVAAVVDASGQTDLLALAQYENNPNSESSRLIGHSMPDILQHIDDPDYAPLVELVHEASPDWHASADDPPCFIVHGDSDSIVPPDQAQRLFDSLSDAGASVVLHWMHGVGHELPSPYEHQVYDFLQEQLTTPMPGMLRAIAGKGDRDKMGNAVAIIGDVDYDGVPDVLIGAPYNNDKAADAGAAFVCSGATGAVLKTFHGQRASDRFGWAVAGLGDTNGDGKPDFAIAAPWFDGIAKDSGRVYVYSGANWTKLRTFDGAAAGDRFGFAIAGAGDVDADARKDIVIGAPYCNPTGTDSGEVYVFSGRTGALLKSFAGAAKGDRFGYSVAGIGDMNHDGRADVIIGAPYNDAAGVDAGRAYIYGFDGSVWRRWRTFNGRSAGSRFGWCVSGAGDFNGDGFADVIVGAPYSDVGAVHCGQAFVFSGKTGGLLKELLPPNAQARQTFGIAVAGAGDVDGDGLDDVIVSASRRNMCAIDQGEVYIFGAAGTTLLQRYPGPHGGAFFGASLAGGADFDHDGRPDLVIGSTGARSGDAATGAAFLFNSTLQH